MLLAASKRFNLKRTSTVLNGPATNRTAKSNANHTANFDQMMA